MSARRAAVLAVPVAVPLSMSVVFAGLRAVLAPRRAYNAGFALYWTAWCLAFPVWHLGPQRAVELLRRGRPLSRAETAVAFAPVLGAVGTALWPYRRQVDPAVAAVLVASAAVNAVGEELLWRGVFLAEFGDDVVLGALWPLAGFALWHLAPQLVLPARIGRGRFVLGAAAVGGCSTAIARRTGGLRRTLLPHAATDACGVTAARFRLGRP